MRDGALHTSLHNRRQSSTVWGSPLALIQSLEQSAHPTSSPRSPSALCPVEKAPGRPGREVVQEVPADLALTLSELVPLASLGLRHSQWLTSGPQVLVAIGDGSLHGVCVIQ